MSVGYLQPVERQFEPMAVLGRAVRAFVRREEKEPVWVEVGEGVTLPPGTARRFGLTRVTGRECRPGCILVGRDDPSAGSG